MTAPPFPSAPAVSRASVERLIESYWRGALRWADVMRRLREMAERTK